MKYIKDHENLDRKNVLLRLDLNVPLKNGIITDQTRIDKILPIINFLLSKNSRIIVVSHVGRPDGKKNSDLSMKPICEYLEKKINKKIKLISDDTVSYTHLRAHETRGNLVCRLLLEKKKIIRVKFPSEIITSQLTA